MQVCRYKNDVKISVSADFLIRALHPEYSEDQIQWVRPYFLAVLKKCKQYPLVVSNVSITASCINSWYTLYGKPDDILKFVHTLVTRELSKS